jgi:cytochrome c-type biogenesis protein CcmE
MVHIDPESPDAGDDALDLTPRKIDDIPRGRKLGPSLVLVAVFVVVGFVLFQGLSGATLSLNEANDAVADRDELGERRFRLLGSPIALVEDDQELNGASVVLFSVACDGIAVDVVHRGNVAESFQMGVPVVLEGRWQNPTSDVSAAIDTSWDGSAGDGWLFESDEMLVKHDNDYRTDRIEQAASCGTDALDAPES